MSLEQGPDDAPNFEDPVEDVVVEFDFEATTSHPLPALYYHCLNVYLHMMTTARKAEEGYVWEGSLTHVFENLGIGIAQYTPVTGRLKQMDCMRQLRRGGGPQPSIWLLIAEPDVERFKLTTREMTVAGQKRRSHSTDQLAQAQRDLLRRVERIEKWARSEGAAI